MNWDAVIAVGLLVVGLAVTMVLVWREEHKDRSKW